MKERFEQIYATNEWQHGSGEGSLPIHTRGYAEVLVRFLRERRVESVVDMGCGDWQFSRGVAWAPTRYQGYDIVSSVIANNRARYAKPDVSFHVYSGDPAELPPADLLIAKDVLQHWSNAAVQRFLPNLSRYRWALLTNCVNPRGRTFNDDIADGGFRYLDLTLPPFELAAKEIFSFENHRGLLGELFGVRPRWRKRVLLVENPTP